MAGCDEVLPTVHFNGEGCTRLRSTDQKDSVDDIGSDGPRNRTTLPNGATPQLEVTVAILLPLGNRPSVPCGGTDVPGDFLVARLLQWPT
jgi:hypothetical protein